MAEVGRHLFRAASASLVQSPDTLSDAVPTSDAAPLIVDGQIPRSTTRRQLVRDQVQQRVFQVLVRRFLVPCFILFIFLFLFSCVFAYVWTLACVAFITQWRKPCDQPLKYYMLMHFLAWCVMQVISPKLLEFFPGRPFAAAVTAYLPCLGVMVWGVHMVYSCETCFVTNPGLFYATRNLIFMQIVYSITMTITFGCGVAAVILFLLSLGEDFSPGCVEAVKKLPQIAVDSPELIDPEDGLVMDCTICLANFSTVNGQVILKTPCGHYFHDNCLLTWCKNHMDCPICRGDVGIEGP